MAKLLDEELRQRHELILSKLFAYFQRSQGNIKLLGVIGLRSFFQRTKLLHPDTVSAMLDCVKSTANPMIHMQGVAFLREILQMYPNRAAQDELISLLYVDNKSLRNCVIEALGELKDIQAIPHLALFLDYEDGELLGCIQWALQRMAYPAADLALQEWQQRQ